MSSDNIICEVQSREIVTAAISEVVVYFNHAARSALMRTLNLALDGVAIFNRSVVSFEVEFQDAFKGPEQIKEKHICDQSS